ncbi:MAG: 2-hydroxyacid dehydrogenase [Verrucomicrobiota bacterium]
MKVAFYDAKPYDEASFQLQSHSRDDLELAFHPFRLNASTASTARGCGAVCAFVNDQIDRDCLIALKEEKVGMVALRCAGFNQVDLAAAAELEIPVTRVPAYSPHAVAEHAIALLFSLNRRIHRAYNRVREWNFSLDGLVGFDLHGKTVGIVGTGKIGRITAEIFLGFGCRVLAHDLYPISEWARERGITYCDLEDLLAKSDVISLHTPLTPETYHLLDDEALGSMKKGVYVINTSRGKLIKTRALIRALKERRVGGVALDVYEIEEGVFFEDLSHDILHDDELARLLTFPNVLVTSHQGFLTEEALAEIARTTCENLVRFSNGESFLDGTELSGKE